MKYHFCSGESRGIFNIYILVLKEITFKHEVGEGDFYIFFYYFIIYKYYLIVVFLKCSLVSKILFI